MCLNKKITRRTLTVSNNFQAEIQARLQFETRKDDRLYSCQLPKGRSDLSGGLKTVFQGPSFHPKIASKSILDRYQVGAHLAPATLARQWKI